MLNYLVEKEIKTLARNPYLPKIIFILPAFLLLILPWAADQEIKNLRLVVVDNDKGAVAVQMVNQIVSTGYFRLSSIEPTTYKALERIESGQSDLLLEIPPHFERQLADTRPVSLHLSVNAVDGMRGMLASTYLSAILTDFADAQRARISLESGGARLQSSVRYFYNARLDYKAFMVPAIIVILLTLLCGFLPALSIVGEKEAGTIEQINVTPVSKTVFILGKLIPYWAIGILTITIGFGIAASVYRLLPVGNLAVIYLYSAIYIAAVSGLGLVISNYSDTLQQAMFIIFFFILILVILSGLFTPVASMPPWAQLISAADPLKYFMQVMRSVYLKGSTLFDLLPQLAVLTGFALFFNLWAILSYRKSQ
jgi:ABC-2 type transport system permease protein